MPLFGKQHEVDSCEKYFGIYLNKDIKIRESKNLKDKIDAMSKTLNHWLTRHIAIFGRNLLSESEGVSKMIYPAYSLYITPHSIKKINSVINQFIRRYKTHYIKKKNHNWSKNTPKEV